jgi:hypothetical protein
MKFKLKDKMAIATLVGAIRGQDGFGQGYGLNLKGRGATQTLPGGLCSLAIQIATLVFVLKRTLYMVSREEPRMTQVDQGIDILDKN